MHWQEITAITLPDLHTLGHETSLPVLFTQGHHHVEERVRLLLNLTSADWRQQKLIEFIDIRRCSIDFATISASKIFLGFSVLDVASPNHRSLNHHKFVDVTLPQIPKSIQVYFLERRHIHQSHIDVLLCSQQTLKLLLL